jgi:hypothetical protein
MRKLTPVRLADALREVLAVLFDGEAVELSPIESERVSRLGVRATERRFVVGEGRDALAVTVRRAYPLAARRAARLRAVPDLPLRAVYPYDAARTETRDESAARAFGSLD